MNRNHRMVAGLCVLTALFVVATFVTAGIAIWTHGPDASRWGGTAVLAFIAAFVSGICTALAEES